MLKFDPGRKGIKLVDGRTIGPLPTITCFWMLCVICSFGIVFCLLTICYCGRVDTLFWGSWEISCSGDRGWFDRALVTFVSGIGKVLRALEFGYYIYLSVWTVLLVDWLVCCKSCCWARRRFCKWSVVGKWVIEWVAGLI